MFNRYCSKRLTGLLVYLLLLSGCISTEPLSLTIDTDKNRYNNKEMINLNIILENVSSRTLSILQHTALMHYPFNAELKNPDGSVQRFLGSEIALDYEDSMFVALAPGDRYKERINLGVDDENEIIFDFSKDGTYTLQLSYRGPMDRLDIQSNSIKFTVLP